MAPTATALLIRPEVEFVIRAGKNEDSLALNTSVVFSGNFEQVEFNYQIQERLDYILGSDGLIEQLF